MFSCERAALSCWRGKQKAELAFACCFSPALPLAIQEQIPQQLVQETFPGMRLGSGRPPRQAALLPYERLCSRRTDRPQKGLEGTSEAEHPSAALSGEWADAPSAVDLWTFA